MGLSFFISKDEKIIKRALEITKKRMELDKELNQLRPQVQQCLENKHATQIQVAGVGKAVIKFNTHKVLDTEKLVALLKQNPELLHKFVSTLSTVKHGALEKFLGTPAYTGLVSNTETTESVVFIVD